jgi:hypothetical protein
MGAFDAKTPIGTAPGQDSDTLENQVEAARTESSAIYYVVDTRVEALALEGEIARDWLTLDPTSQSYLSIGIFPAEVPENEAVVDTLTAPDSDPRARQVYDEAMRLGLQFRVVDLR